MQRNRTASWEDVLNVDFSAESEKKNDIKQALLRQVCEQGTVLRGIVKEDIIMNQTQKRRIKRSTVIAIAACLTLAISVTAFAVADYLNLGKYAQYVTSEMPDYTLEELSEMEGLPIESYFETQSGYADNDQSRTLFDTLDEAQTYLAFDARSFGYVPSSYTLEGYRIFNNENGQPEQNTKYLEFYFNKNNDSNKRIYVQARLMDDETGYTDSGLGGLKKIDINGYDAIVMDSSVDILIDDVIYGIIAHDLPQSELIKMAESLTK